MARIFKNKKIIFVPLISAAILLFLSCSVFLTQRVSANGPIELKKICDDPKPAATSTSFSSLATKIFRFSIVAAALLGVIMITIGGFMYVAAAGSTSTITKAKDMIWNAIIGLIIVISSVFILWTINPDLVSMKLPIPEVKIEPIPPPPPPPQYKCVHWFFVTPECPKGRKKTDNSNCTDCHSPDICCALIDFEGGSSGGGGAGGEF